MNIIGKKYKPTDNSYCINLNTKENAFLAVSIIYPQNICIISSQPYEEEISIGPHIKYTRQFIDVKVDDKEYRLLYDINNVIKFN